MHSRIDRPILHEVQRRFGVRRRGIAVKQPPYGEDNCSNNEANAARFEIEADADRRADPWTSLPSFDRHGSSFTLLLRRYLLSHLLARVSLSTRSDRCSRGRRRTVAWWTSRHAAWRPSRASRRRSPGSPTYRYRRRRQPSPPTRVRTRDSMVRVGLAVHDHD